MLHILQADEEQKRSLQGYLKDGKEDTLKLVHQESLLIFEEIKLANRKKQIKNKKDKWQDKAQHG